MREREYVGLNKSFFLQVISAHREGTVELSILRQNKAADRDKMSKGINFPTDICKNRSKNDAHQDKCQNKTAFNVMSCIRTKKSKLVR